MFTLLDLKKTSLRACAMRYLEASIFLRIVKSGVALGDPKNDVIPSGNSLDAACYNTCAIRYLAASIVLRIVKSGAALGDPKNDVTREGIPLTLRATTHARCGILKLLFSSAT